MQKIYIRGIALAAGAAAIFSPLAAHAQVGNGGFETPFVPNNVNLGQYQLFNTNSTIGAWTVVSGNVELIRTYWSPNSGLQSIDLNGSAPGAIQQTLTTTANHAYQISFAMAGNPSGGPAIKQLSLFFGANTANFSFNTTGKARGNMGWTVQTATFTATGANTLLKFAAAGSNNTPFGPALDDISIRDLGPVRQSAAPEPSAVALAGLGLLPLGMLLRRRK